MRLFLLAALLGALAVPSSASAADAVVGLIDTGINPYHATFRDSSPRAQQHPSTYLPGYPADAQALPLTMDAPDWATAVAADCKLWQSVEPKKLYWVPGTKIVGMIGFTDKPEEIDCEEGDPADALLLDTNGHGTMTASRAASIEYGACKTCRVVSIHYPNDGLEPPAIYQEALRWAAAHRTWLDAQSNSWGPLTTAYEPTDGQAGILAAGPPLLRTIEATASVHTAFWASMNGAAGRAGVLGHPTQLAPHLTPSVLMIGGHDSGHVTAWTGSPPHAAADACNAFAAYSNHLDESDGTVSSGTSGATPYVAGGAAQILIDARAILGTTRTGSRGDVMASGPAGLVASGPLADGIFTRAEWRELFLKTASPRPEPQEEDATTCLAPPYNATVPWSSVPDEFPEYLSIGYGAVDRKSVALAGQVLRGAPMPDRKRTDDFFAQDDRLRRALHEQYTMGRAEDPPAAVPAPPEAPAGAPAPGGAGQPPAGAGKGTGTAPRRNNLRSVSLARLARVRCSGARRVRLTLRAGLRSATVKPGSGRARAFKRTVTLKLPARGRLVVLATARGGKRLRAERAFRRCADLR